MSNPQQPPGPPVPPGPPPGPGPSPAPVQPGSPRAGQILDQPVSGTDLTAELKQSKRSFGKLTVGLAAAVLVVAAFFGGIATHAAIADDSGQPGAQNGRQFPGGQRPGGGQGPGILRGGTLGTIERVEGTDVYVKTPDGRTVKVSTSDSTQVRISQEGNLSDLKPSQNVAVQGSTGGDGTVSAETITEQPFRATG